MGHYFDHVAKEVKSVFTFSRWPLMTELKFKMADFAVFWILLISALPLEVTFQMLTHFRQPWSKNTPRTFERWSSNRVIEVNVQGGSAFHVF